MYKIYYNNIPIIISAQKYNNKLNNDNSFLTRYSEINNIDDVIKLFQGNSHVNNIFVPDDKIEEFWKKFKSHFYYLEAAGGVVHNKDNKALFIFKNKLWDLPKGKTEKGETTQETAIREVEEECGINGLEIEKELQSTYHIYVLDNDYYLKKTYWYMINCNGKDTTHPLLEENIEKAVWLTNSEIQNLVLSNTYNTILDVIKSNHLLKVEF